MAEDEEGGQRDLSLHRSTGRRRRILATLEEKKALWRQLEENDDATLVRHCELWEQKTGVAVSVSTMSRAIREKLGWSYKKRLRVLRPWCSRRLALLV
ncbi:MAG: hypothetical protein M3N18_11765 [Actinomycetota bacterium]|nr:hypothetical protein [Actinomycetota bacterium]